MENKKNFGLNPINMDCLAMEYKQLQNEIDKLETRLEMIKNEIKKCMNEETEYRTETFHFIYKTIISEKFDTTKFKKDNPVIAQSYMKESVSRPLKIN